MISEFLIECVTGLLDDKEEANKGASMFVHEYSRSAGYYANRTFEPEYKKRPDEILPANRFVDFDVYSWIILLI